MGTLIFYSDDPAVLPRVSSNACGAESWSGLRVDQLSENQIEQLLRYCRTEGHRQGWNDSVGRRQGDSREGPFHPELLGGELSKMWQESYDEGADERERIAHSPCDFHPRTGGDEL
ncbi:MAG: hypothetical protein E7I01_18690 [Aeromonas sp.]|uniref:hypothetical protein n=1 Tax=Aeromonas sp. TaxID=647 RepID=UPI00290B03B2|nr:hypothetical protein [Aeromonas sp.]MDU4190127.1 hypothetical protein [Aeromonas sp.]